MTKPVGFRRKPEKTQNLIKIRYHKHPKVVELMENRHITYNETMEYIEKQSKAGNLFLIRPDEDLNIGRMEKNPDKLSALYLEGYKDAEKNYEEMLHYLNRG